MPGEVTMEKIQNNLLSFESISSTTYEKFLKIANIEQNRDLLIKHHENHLTRVYPKGWNVNSGNFNPINCWKVGAQIAALNIQTLGLYHRLNRAMFRLNGGSGFVQKPNSLHVSYHNRVI